MQIKNPNRDEKIRISVAMLSIGFGFIVVYYYWMGMFLEKGFPFNTFLNGPNNRFGDFYGPFSNWAAFQFKEINYGLVYFPSTYLVLDALSWVSGGNPYTAFAIFETCFCVFIALYIYKNTKIDQSGLLSVQNIIAFTVMSYPFLFTFATGNLEAFIFSLLAIFLIYFQKGNFYKCAIPLGLAISMKAIPGLFLILLIAEKKYKAILLVFLVIIIASIIPLLIFDGGFNTGIIDYLYRLSASQDMYFDLMVNGGSGTAFGHSILNALRMIMPIFPPIKTISTPYLGFVLIILSGIVFYILKYESVIWKRVMIITSAICLLPLTSTDYKLLHFLIPLFLLINHNDLPSEIKKNRLFLMLTTLILIPKHYFYFYDSPFNNINNILNTLLMIVIPVMIIFDNPTLFKKNKI
jgi:hypothetical protein